MMNCPNPDRFLLSAGMLSALFVLSAAVSAHASDRQLHPARAEAVDNRYNHGAHDPRLGAVVRTLPPIGMHVPMLPRYHNTVWLGGVPYHYADETFYRWETGTDTYEVVSAPAGADRLAVPPPAVPAEPPNDPIYAYPQDGQTSEQQAADRYECHAWSKNQTGFDPAEPGGGVAPDQNKSKRSGYDRAMSACLEARHYTVR